MSKVCAEPGCPTLTTTSRCPEHTDRRHRSTPRDPAQNRFYASARWAAIRTRQLREHPLCQCDRDCCPNGCHGVATEVDHIDGNWRNNDRGNHRSLTKSCHSRRTARDQAFRAKPTPSSSRRRAGAAGVG